LQPPPDNKERRVQRELLRRKNWGISVTWGIQGGLNIASGFQHLLIWVLTIKTDETWLAKKQKDLE
jgi:hypothetical protein